MNPILYEKNEDGFLTNGIGRLTDTLECRVTEERNGVYELEMKYPATGVHFDSIQNERILYCRHSDALDLQPFRIYKITKPMNGRVSIFARHISYDLSKMTVMPCEATNCAEALMEINANTISGSKFTFWTDKTTTGRFEVRVPSAIRSVLGGKEGSILDTFGGGEYEFDHYVVKLHANRGTDSGVTIRYGKNLQDITQELDAGGVITGVAPFWMATSEEKTVVTLPEGAIIAASSATGVLTEYYWDEAEQIYRDERGVGYETSADTLGIVPLDLSSQFDEQPTVAQLRAAAVAYLRESAARLEETESIKVSFTHLWQTEEYKNVAPLQRLRLCDTAQVYYPRYEIEITAKVVKTVYNVLLERYDSMELGDVRNTLAKAINGQSLKIEAVKTEVEDKSASMMAAAIDHATQMIQGGLGGHVVMKPNADGEPEEILIMDTDDTATAVNVIRLNKNGIAFSRNGYNGNYRTGWTIDGNFVADFITTGTLNANLIKTGTMSADRILGGTMKLGGTSNNNGVLEIYNSAKTRVGRFDNNAIYLGNIAGSGTSGLSKPKLKISIDGSITSNATNYNAKLYDGQFKLYQANGTMLGFIGAQEFTGESTLRRGVVFDIESNCDYMSWGAQGSASSTTYTQKMVYANRAFGPYKKDTMNFLCAVVAQEKVTFERSTTFEGRRFWSSSTSTDYDGTWSNGGIYHFGEHGFGAKKETETSTSAQIRFAYNKFRVSNGVKVDFFTNIDMHGYSILNQSDIRLKKNIKTPTVSALETLNEIAIREYDWISGPHVKMGMIAQQVEMVEPALTVDGCSIKTTDFIPYLIKAIQELSQRVGIEVKEKPYADKFSTSEKEEFYADTVSKLLRDEIREVAK